MLYYLHMKHEVSKRRQPVMRTVIYSVMTLCVLVIVTILMLIVLGYSFDERKGTLEQGGLLQFTSIPQGAIITLDEVKLGPRTNTKATVDAGSHSVNYDRDGYRSWRKTIHVDPGQIGWLNYARLIPNTISPQSLRTFTTLSGALASPKQNYMLLHQSADQPTFALANIRGDTVQYRDIALPSGSYTEPAVGKTHRFTLDSWSADEQAVLIRHTYNDNEVEWLLLNRDSPERSVNITKTFAVEPSKIIFAGTGNRLLFVQTGDIVRRINLDDQTLSRPLATGVATFTGYDEKTITYASLPNDKQQRTVGYAKTDIVEPQIIFSYPADSQPLFASMSTYFNRRYVTVLHGQQLTVHVGNVPTPNQKSTLKQFTKQTVPEGALSLDITRNNRFAVVQLRDGYATYDIELKKFDKTTWTQQPAVSRELEWIDDYILWTDYGNQLRFYEFDGANQQNIMPVTEGFDVSVSPNDKYVYGIMKTTKGYEFRRALLILP